MVSNEGLLKEELSEIKRSVAYYLWMREVPGRKYAGSAPSAQQYQSEQLKKVKELIGYSAFKSEFDERAD